MYVGSTNVSSLEALCGSSSRIREDARGVAGVSKMYRNFSKYDINVLIGTFSAYRPHQSQIPNALPE
jgi:hypothetical protein